MKSEKQLYQWDVNQYLTELQPTAEFVDYPMGNKEKVSAWLADNPTTVYYETKSDELTDVTIPEALTEWLPVEAGGTVTFQNADESKQLPVPNAVSWVRKLNEVN